MPNLWTPGSDYPGSNMPGGTQSRPASPFPNESPGFGLPKRKFSFSERLGKAVAAGSAPYGDRRPWDDKGPMPKFDTSAALAQMHPEAPEAWQIAKWAFRGTRTTQTHSLAHEQNLYGGVQRDSIPTERISTWNRSGPTANQQENRRDRRVLDYEELNIPQGGTAPVAASAPPPSFTMGSPAPGFSSESRHVDPLFAQNTGSSPFNAAQFGDVHQRATAGVPQQPRV